MKRIVLDEVFHSADHELRPGELRPGGSRWGHDGVFTWVDPEPAPNRYLYRIPGPHVVLGVEDQETGSWDLARGWGSDDEFNALLAELWDGKSWPVPVCPASRCRFLDRRRSRA